MASSKCLTIIFILVAGAMFAGLPGSAVAGSSASPVAAVNTTDGLALKGYDPVAYFTDGQPTKGADQYSFQWKGVTYRFASAENLQRFKADPDKYLPQYGGYCAYAMSLDRIADIDPSPMGYRRRKTLLEQWLSRSRSLVTEQEREHCVC